MTTKLIYVAGTGRSGSTLLGNALGSLPGALSVGEVKLGLRRGLVDGGFCGCRAQVRNCPVWGPALTATFGAIPSPAEAADLDQRLSALVRTRQVPRWVAGTDLPEIRFFADLFGRLLAHVAEVSGATTLIDSSKLPAYGALLTRSPDLDVRTVHLVRDPRAVAWSWQRSAASQQVAGFEEPMERFSPTKSSLMWLESSSSVAALAARSQRRAHRVRYEDLVADPARTISNAARFAGLDPDVSFVQDGSVDLSPNHAIAGNPNRVRTGPVQLQADNEWAAQMSPAQRRLVSAVTFPRRGAHGY